MRAAAPMGDFGEATAQAYQFSRADQDAYAVETLDPGAGGDRERCIHGRDRAGHRDGQGRRPPGRP